VVDRTYGQFCAIARSLDVVGDRWTLLVVRELLRGPRTFASLEASLHGISSTLLSERLTRLRTDGLVVRNDAPQRSKAVTYALTELGAGLEPVLFALLRWGGWSMVRGQGDDHVDPEWSGLALKALLDGTAGPPPPTDPRDDATVHVSVDGGDHHGARPCGPAVRRVRRGGAAGRDRHRRLPPPPRGRQRPAPRRRRRVRGRG
jgi:DNA-binding HxlR family transcriptional regulator